MGMKFHKEVKVSTGTYTNQNGEVKKRYTKVGSMFISEDGSSYSIKLDVLPIPNKDGEIWLSCWDKWNDDKKPNKVQDSITQSRYCKEDSPFYTNENNQDVAITPQEIVSDDIPF